MAGHLPLPGRSSDARRPAPPPARPRIRRRPAGGVRRGPPSTTGSRLSRPTPTSGVSIERRPHQFSVVKRQAVDPVTDPKWSKDLPGRRRRLSRRAPPTSAAIMRVHLRSWFSVLSQYPSCLSSFERADLRAGMERLRPARRSGHAALQPSACGSRRAASRSRRTRARPAREHRQRTRQRRRARSTRT